MFDIYDFIQHHDFVYLEYGCQIQNTNINPEVSFGIFVPRIDHRDQFSYNQVELLESFLVGVDGTQGSLKVADSAALVGKDLISK